MGEPTILRDGGNSAVNLAAAGCLDGDLEVTVRGPCVRTCGYITLSSLWIHLHRQAHSMLFPLLFVSKSSPTLSSLWPSLDCPIPLCTTVTVAGWM